MALLQDGFVACAALLASDVIEKLSRLVFPSGLLILFTMLLKFSQYFEYITILVFGSMKRVCVYTCKHGSNQHENIQTDMA